MAEELQGGVCGGGNWWNSSKNLFGSSPCSIASTLQDWNIQDLLHDSGRSVESYPHFLPEAAGLNSGLNYRQQDNNWSSKSFCDLDSSINSFRQVNNQGFPLEQEPSNCFTSSAQSAGFPLNSASYSYTSSLLQTLFDDTDSQPQQQSSLDNQTMNYQMNPMSEFSTTLTRATPMLKPSLPKKQPLWNSTAAAANSSDFGASFLPSTQPQFLPSSQPDLHNFSAKHQSEEAGDSDSAAKKVSSKPAVKRPRIETPSPLPTFKVRKEKLGDRITALQQLVSPFGKTDTASVLQEAIEYIKFLHDQVSTLSTPYLKNGSPPLQHQQAADKTKDQKGLIQDLKSRGLCLVPISSIFPVAAETTADFWTPTLIGGSFR